MSGYNWSAGMSNNAVAAYDGGLTTASKIVRQFGISARCLKEIGPAPREWHHTSAKFNTTDFYDPTEVAAWCKTAEVQDAIAAWRLANEWTEHLPAKVFFLPVREVHATAKATLHEVRLMNGGTAEIWTPDAGRWVKSWNREIKGISKKRFLEKCKEVGRIKYLTEEELDQLQATAQNTARTRKREAFQNRMTQNLNTDPAERARVNSGFYGRMIRGTWQQHRSLSDWQRQQHPELIGLYFAAQPIPSGTSCRKWFYETHIKPRQVSSRELDELITRAALQWKTNR